MKELRLSKSDIARPSCSEGGSDVITNLLWIVVVSVCMIRVVLVDSNLGNGFHVDKSENVIHDGQELVGGRMIGAM